MMTIPTTTIPIHDKNVTSGPASWYILASTNGPKVRPALPDTEMNPIIRPCEISTCNTCAVSFSDYTLYDVYKTNHKGNPTVN